MTLSRPMFPPRAERLDSFSLQPATDHRPDESPTSDSPKPDQPTTRDDELGMAWWNALSKQERVKWSAIAGNTGRPKDAWEAFRRGSVDQSPPVDPTRRRFLAVATGASVASVGSLAVAAAMPATAPYSPACAVDPAFALIAEKLAADAAHCEAIDAQDDAESDHEYGSAAVEEAHERCCVACRVVNKADWRLARTPPTTLAGVAAVLRFANAIEDGGMEWVATDTVGAEGWHYQLRASMAAAIEALIEARAGKVVQA
jgi:hypothetical protein